MAKNLKVVVIGGGIAGVSAAYNLVSSSTESSVVLVEQEKVLKYHTTGRSLAQLLMGYGDATLQPLIRESIAFFKNPPNHCAAKLLNQRDQLNIYIDEEAASSIEADLEIIPNDSVLKRFPAINSRKVIAAAVQPQTY